MSRLLPEWYNEAKFGIFIHWGLFSVPGWAYSESGKSIADIHEKHNPYAGQKYNPYAEWYLNSLRIDGSPTQEYHEKVYGKNFRYEDFQKSFEEQTKSFDAGKWAELFKKAGARYAVMVTKHHDGYCLWPSEYPNPKNPEYGAKRDYVGELTQAVREKGLKMGLYYSGILDWSFKAGPMNSQVRWLDHYLQSDEYAEYSLNQTKELIRRYHPSILWNDMGYPAQCDLDELFAGYLKEVPDGVINDRWTQRKLSHGQTIEEYAAELEKQDSVMDITEGQRGDFYTPEYQKITELPDKKWESTRGIGMSFGYNRNESRENFLTGKQLIYMLSDIVSKNGNLLLNVGPCADGTIEEAQQRPLLEAGAWLERNGEAIYGTVYGDMRKIRESYTEEDKRRDEANPDSHAVTESVTGEGKKVCFTRKAGKSYAIVLDDAPGAQVEIKGLHLPEGTKLTLVGGEEGRTLAWKDNAQGTWIGLKPTAAQDAYVIRFE